MTKKEIKEKLIELFNEQGISVDQNIDEETIVNSLEIDSLDRVELIMMIEEKFNIAISDEEESNIFKIKDYIDMINSKVNTKKECK